MPARAGRRRLLAPALLGLSVLVGCVTTVERAPGGLRPPDRASDLAPRSALSRSGVRTVGTIPYDGFTLPVASPDGRFVAIQAGVPPDWPTLLGTAGSRPPLASTIEVWECLDTATRVASLPRGYVLGRGADARGFLIEAPQADGSRWIGKVPWPGALRPVEVQPLEAGKAPLDLSDPVEPNRPEWLVQDDRVNAFAALGPDGELAWCVRGRQEAGFRLAVRGPGGVAFEDPPGVEASWMLPVFAGRGADLVLYLIRLRDGIADLAFGKPLGEDAWRQGLQIRPLTDRADARVAWQMLAPQGTATAIGEGTDDRLVFFHPDARRMAIWDPADDSVRLLEPDSFAAALDGPYAALVSRSDGLFRERIRGPAGLAEPRERSLAKPIRLLDRTAVPRPIGLGKRPSIADDPNSAAGRDWLLFRPERKSIRVLRLFLMDIEPTTGAG